jgi:hypothetical protein
MNFGGNIPIVKRDTTESDRIWNIKQWYLLYYKPKNINEYNTAISMANIYINKFYEEMNYNVPNINGILEHIDLNLV